MNIPYQFTDNLSEEGFEGELEEMNLLWKESLKLPYDMLIDYEGKTRNHRINNSPRVFVSLDDIQRDIVPISIDKENPEVLIDREIPEFEVIKEWIKKNYDILIRHWNQRLDDYITLKLLKRRVLRKELKVE